MSCGTHVPMTQPPELESNALNCSTRTRQAMSLAGQGLLGGHLYLQFAQQSDLINEIKLTRFKRTKCYLPSSDARACGDSVCNRCLREGLRVILQQKRGCEITLISTQPWNFIFERARPFSFFAYGTVSILKVYSKLLKGHQGQDQGQHEAMASVASM